MFDMDHKEIKLKLQEKEVEIAVWASLKKLQKLYQNEQNSKGYFTGITNKNKKIKVNYDCFKGVYPNKIDQGLGRGHIRQLKSILRQQKF